MADYHLNQVTYCHTVKDVIIFITTELER